MARPRARWLRWGLAGGALVAGLTLALPPLFALTGPAPVLGGGGATSGGPLALAPTAGPPGSTFVASFSCTGLATLAVTRAADPSVVVWSDADSASGPSASFSVVVPPSEPEGRLRVVGVCARHGGDGDDGYDGYDGDDGYDGYDGDDCAGYDGYDGYDGDDGYDGYDRPCAVRTFGPAFFTVVAPTGGPTVSIDDLAVAEPDARSVRATLTVSLSAPSSDPVRVRYATRDGSATDGRPRSEDRDYRRKTGMLWLQPGTTTKTIDVRVLGDVRDEGDESFTVELLSARGATIADGTGTVTIVDGDDPVIVSVDDAAVVEGDRRAEIVEVRLRLSRPSDAPVRVRYSTVDGTATDGRPRSEDDDYRRRRGVVRFAPGTTEAFVRVRVRSDARPEGEESFAVELLSARGATVGDGTATVRIVDDD